MKPSFLTIAHVLAIGCAGVLGFLMTSCQPKAPAGNYDLVAESMIASPAIVHVGDKVSFQHSVSNQGRDTVPGGTYTVDLYVDGRRVGFDHGTRDLGPGLKAEYGKSPGAFHWQPTKPGLAHYRLVVDEANNLPETSKSNNVLEGDIEVLP